MDNIDIDFFPVYIGKLKKEIQKKMNNLLSPYNLTSIHSMYLLLLNKSYSGLTLSELTAGVDVDKANTTRVINDLEKKGYVYRDNTKLNERKYKIFLTEKGEDIANIVQDYMIEKREQILKSFTPEEIKQFSKFLIKTLKEFSKLN